LIIGLLAQLLISGYRLFKGFRIPLNRCPIYNNYFK
jgi:hypothetical protein